MNWRWRPKDDRELEQATGIQPADHHFETPESIKKREREILGPSWGRKRRPFKLR